MSLESAVERLAYAVEDQAQNSAVAEIIRQRDAALKERDRWKSDAEYYQKGRDERYTQLEHERRVSAALRGVITRMRSKGARGV
jgi:hypothetical protein